MKKGDILHGKRTKHPIVFLSEYNSDQFVGCILTHSNDDRFPDNIAMSEEHFLNEDESGERYKIVYDDSFFVNQKLLKKSDWGPFEKVGQLSDSGIAFIEQYKNDNLTTWDLYLNSD